VILVVGMLLAELVKVKGDWLWCSGRIGSMLEVEFGCLGKLVVEEAKDMMENIAGGPEPIA
jgi:hypothetical protein